MSNGSVTLWVWKLSSVVLAHASRQWMDLGFGGQHSNAAENSRNRRNVKWSMKEIKFFWKSCHRLWWNQKWNALENFPQNSHLPIALQIMEESFIVPLCNISFITNLSDKIDGIQRQKARHERYSCRNVTN